MEKNDWTKAKKIFQDDQQLSVFYLADRLEEFSDLMGKISDLCQDVIDWGPKFSEKKFCDSLKNLSFQIKKDFENN